jgi:predicted phosphoribosyltransferase
MLDGADVFSLCFADRREAGRVLAAKLKRYAGREDVIVIGLAAGGMVVAGEIAKQLQLPVDVLLMRRLQVPGHEYLHMGAVAEGGPVVLNPGVIQSVGLHPYAVEMSAVAAEAELQDESLCFRKRHPRGRVRDKVVILADDGIVTGASMRAAVAALRERRAAQIIIASAVVPAMTCDLLKHAAERVVTLAEPEVIGSLDEWYEEFEPISDFSACEVVDHGSSGAGYLTAK